MTMKEEHQPWWSRQVDTFLFDMDGVIVDSEPLYFEIEAQSCRRYGIQLADQDQHAFVGVTLRDMWTKLRRDYQLRPSVAELVQEHEQHVLDMIAARESLPITPQIRELLERLQQGGYKIGLASSSSRALINRILEKSALRPFFQVIVSGQDVDQGKPAPDIFLRAAELLDAQPSRCCVIEDSAHGVQAAKSAGMTCLAYLNPNSGNQNIQQADYKFQNFQEIIKQIERKRA
ncbi:HAD family hydrolase [Marinicrinis sediminis]|uniref:HAD family hydrolase n=1 Tax=Marinicrinis sediminis TaxID=1652465 RepID=A0ABW5R8J6_9BACL